MTAHEKLINYVLSLTEEQLQKVLNHPEFEKVVKEYGKEKSL